LKQNIIFVLLDGARWDRLHLFKKFTELQKKGCLMNNVTAAYPYTFAAMNAIFTGMFGKENGVDAYYKMFRLKDSVQFLPEVFQQNGYFTSCDIITDKVISARGFDIYQAHDEYNDDLTIRHPKFLKECFRKANGKPIFTFLQFSKIHTVTVSEVIKNYEWDDRDFYDNQSYNLKKYDEAFQEACKYAELIQKTLEGESKMQETIVIFFADHGTGVGERYGERNYGIYAYEETIRTFHLFIGPNIQKNKISDQLLSSTSLFHTLLDLSGITSNSEGSFVPYLLGKSEKIMSEPNVFSETGGLVGPFPSPEEPNVFCIKNSVHKLMYFKTPNEWKLFNFIQDPKEMKNLYGENLPIEEELKEKLLNWINR
tara:strand:+ start:1113 stop:2219 length:1107 start_codon:yes stop_codon:yes gene_type:complete